MLALSPIIRADAPEVSIPEMDDIYIIGIFL
jgi:hypothetical protein